MVPLCALRTHGAALCCTRCAIRRHSGGEEAWEASRCPSDPPLPAPPTQRANSNRVSTSTAVCSGARAATRPSPVFRRGLRQAEERDVSQWGKGAVGTGSRSGRTASGGLLWGWSGERIWLSLADPKLEMGMKNRGSWQLPIVLIKPWNVWGPLLRVRVGLPGWLPQVTAGSLGWLPEVSALSHGVAVVCRWPPSLGDYPSHAPRSAGVPAIPWASLTLSSLVRKVGTTNTTLQSGCGTQS